MKRKTVAHRFPRREPHLVRRAHDHIEVRTTARIPRPPPEPSAPTKHDRVTLFLKDLWAIIVGIAIVAASLPLYFGSKI